MTYGSLFSGIGGFDKGFDRAGLQCAWQVENDPNCNHILRRHWPEVKRYGDITKIDTAKLARPDILCGGFPCQDLSIAGRRSGLAGERSGLWFEFLRILWDLKTPWVVIENVPGLFSSDGGKDFAIILQGLEKCGYHVAWRVLDANGFGVPQRRRRVFIVGHLGDGRAAEVLFESEGVCRDTSKGRKTRTGIAAITADGVGTCGADDNQAQAGHLIYSMEGEGVGKNSPTLCGGHAGYINNRAPCIALPTISSKWAKGTGGRSGNECQNLICHALSSDGADASEDGTGRGTPIVPIAFTERSRLGGRNFEYQEDLAYAITNPGGGGQAHSSRIAVPSISPALDATHKQWYDDHQIKEDHYANAEERNPGEILQVLRNAIGPQAMEEWCLGVLVAFWKTELLQSEVCGEIHRREASKNGYAFLKCSLAQSESCPSGIVFAVWCGECLGCASQGRKLSQSFLGELRAYLSELSQPRASKTKILHDLREATKGLRLLQQTLSEIQEVGRSTDSERQPVCSSEERIRDETHKDLHGPVVQGKSSRSRLLQQTRSASQTRENASFELIGDEKGKQGVMMVRRLTPL